MQGGCPPFILQLRPVGEEKTLFPAVVTHTLVIQRHSAACSRPSGLQDYSGELPPPRRRRLSLQDELVWILILIGDIWEKRKNVRVMKGKDN